jgi:hypothetical protein
MRPRSIGPAAPLGTNTPIPSGLIDQFLTGTGNFDPEYTKLGAAAQLSGTAFAAQSGARAARDLHEDHAGQAALGAAVSTVPLDLIPGVAKAGRGVVDWAAKHGLTGAVSRADQQIASMVARRDAAPAARSSGRTLFNEVHPEQFESAVNDFAAARPSEAPFLTQRSAQQMRAENMKTYLSHDGKTGYALGPLDDQRTDIRNVFNHGAKGSGAHAIADAIGNGGNVLDHFDTKLGDVYRDFGFKEYTPNGESARMPWNQDYAPDGWDMKKYGTPDVVNQRHAGGKADDVLAAYQKNKNARLAEADAAGAGLKPMADSVAMHAPNVIVNNDWKPTSRQVFPRDPGADLYREPKALPFTPQAKPKSKGIPDVANRIAEDPRVEARILSDFNKGQGQGGMGWYGHKELRDFVDQLGGPFSYQDVTAAGSAGSARTSTHNELTNMSLNLYGKANGLTAEESRAEFLKRFPGTMKPTYMGMHRDIFDRATERGIVGPNGPTDGALKIPHYDHNRQLGANGVPIDAHEQTMMSQAMNGEVSRDDIKEAMAKGGGVAYDRMTQPYLRVAKQLGVHPDQVQASRWLGGGLQTGLKSQPSGDFLQTIEDGLLFTARSRGLDETPKGLRGLFGSILKGQDFFLPTSAAGGFPVY